MVGRPCFWSVILLFCVFFPAGAHSQLAEADTRPKTPVHRVFASAPPVGLMVYALDRSSLVAVNMPARNGSNNGTPRFLNSQFLALPVIGGWHGNRQPNLEEILLLNPELIVLWDTPLLSDVAEKALARMNRRVFRLNIDGMGHYASAFRRLGQALDREERGEQLARYIEKELTELETFVATIPMKKRVKVYYAEDENGLRSDCDQSFHADVLSYAGGDNVLKCRQSTVMGMQRINFEQLLKVSPEIIVAQEGAFKQTIAKDSKWRLLPAVREQRVIFVPKTPFNWIDRPPSFMRVLGAHWLARSFYPGLYPYDLKRKTKDFFSMFFQVELSDEELIAYFPFL
jgi:iron complex transport system substrate-binding protein